jgi:hypothetical protein
MGPLTIPITNRRRSITNRRRSRPRNDQNGNLTPLHFQILHWVEARQAGEARPRIDGLSGFSIDTAVAELILMDLVKAVSIPHGRYGRAHWAPTGLTATGFRALLRHRRRKAQPVTHPWWPLHVWG